MSRRLVLHVGLMKSGTSFLQQVLRGNQSLLREHGVLYPGGTWRRQVKAVTDVVEHGGPGQPPLDPEGVWATIIDEAAAWSGTSVISMEFLGPRTPAKVKQIVAGLPDLDVQVVVSVRDLARTIPAMWQESVQNRGRLEWADYLEGVRLEDRSQPGPGRAFWARQDASGVVSTWQRAVGRDHLTLITVPPPGAPHSVLWERFAYVLGVEGSGVDLDVRGNASLGLASLLVLRELNTRLDASGAMSGRAYEQVVKRFLAKQGLATRRGEPRVGYDAPWVRERADREISALAALGPRVVGDLEELRAAPVPGVDPAEVPPVEQLAAALDALAQVTEELGQRPRRRARPDRRRPGPRRGPSGGEAGGAGA